MKFQQRSLLLRLLFSRPFHNDGSNLFTAATNSGNMAAASTSMANGCCQASKTTVKTTAAHSLTRPDLDFDFLLSKSNMELIERNCSQRKSLGNIHCLHSIWTELQQFVPFTAKQAPSQAHIRSLWDQLYAEAALLPNISDPKAPIGAESNARLVEEFGGKKHEADWMLTAEQLVDGWGALRWPKRGTGARSYAFIGPLAELERALLDYAFDFVHLRLQREEPGVKRVELVKVDDILPISITREGGCGVQQRPGQHPIQYRVFRAHELYGNDNNGENEPENEEPNAACKPLKAEEKKEENSADERRKHTEVEEGFCLSGTAEMGIANRIKNRLFEEAELPTYFLAESCCFRPEIAGGGLEGGLYRVHEFKKIEMFVVCTEEQSATELERLVQIQRALLDSLQFHCRILDMPTEELGAPAARKFDIECWLPGRRAWGELTSASNCTDYQSRRLHIRYKSREDGTLRYAHTCNGTGLASSRSLIALLETHQQRKRKLDFPSAIKQRLRSSTDRSPVLRSGPAPAIKYNFDE